MNSVLLMCQSDWLIFRIMTSNSLLLILSQKFGYSVGIR